jgi:DNA repair protein RecN (Recombination protein N)
MLEEIRIRGLGVISDAVLELGPGLTVVTGETGAGKTMVVTGLGLLFGGRADSSRLRPGVDSASVEGRLLVGDQSPAAAVVIEAGGDLDSDGSLVLRRVITAAGRSRAAAGGASVPATVLARLAENLVAVHGQSDQQRLTQPAEQRLTLDRFAGVDLQDCRAAFQQWRAAVAELARRTGAARELAREAELLQHGLDGLRSRARTWNSPPSPPGWSTPTRCGSPRVLLTTPCSAIRTTRPGTRPTSRP